MPPFAIVFSTMTSKRTNQFKDSLIKQLPFSPNEKQVKVALENDSLLSLLLDFLTWKQRLIPKRPRKLIIEKHFLEDERISKLDNQINQLFSEIGAGNDLNPYLSKYVNTKGYIPSQYTNGNKWADKDELLHTTGFHHLHFEKYPKRTKELVFARITRDEFNAIAIFGHSVFGNKQANGYSCTNEEHRLMAISSEYSFRGCSSDGVFATSDMTTSCHPLHIREMASIYNEIIFNNDPKLDDTKFISSIYDEVEFQIPRNNKLCWYIYGLDLGLIDKNNQFIIFKEGFI